MADEELEGDWILLSSLDSAGFIAGLCGMAEVETEVLNR